MRSVRRDERDMQPRVTSSGAHSSQSDGVPVPARQTRRRLGLVSDLDAEHAQRRADGENDLVAANTNPDGSDNPSGRTANRSATLTITV